MIIDELTDNLHRFKAESVWHKGITVRVLFGRLAARGDNSPFENIKKDDSDKSQKAVLRSRLMSLQNRCLVGSSTTYNRLRWHVLEPCEIVKAMLRKTQ